MAEELDADGGNVAQLLECRPTVFVGLGGTGMEILLRLRRRVLQHTWNGNRLSSLSDFPIAAFLYFDTDTNEARETGRAAASDAMGVAVRFAQGDSLQKKVDVDHYQRETRSFPEVAEWLPKADLSKFDTSKGAGQVRSISRLLFFDVFSEFTKLFQAKATRVLSNVQNDAALSRLGLKSNPSLRVVIVGSSAGGTGSGAFIDVGYAISSMQTPEAQQVDLFLLLPSGYTGAGRERVFANTYAAMMELEHVMREQRDAPYVEKWTQFDRVRPGKKPFKDVFLLDTANLVQERTGNVTDLYEMVADILFEDFDSELARRKRSVAVNQEQHKMSSYHPPLPIEFGQKSMAYSRGYSTIGQCTVATKGRIQLDTAIAEAGLGMIESFFGIARTGQKNVPNAESRDEFLHKHLKLGVSAFEEYPEDLKNRPPSISEYELVNFLLLRPNKSSIQDALVDQLQTEFRDVTERFTDIKDWSREVENVRERRKTDVDGKPGTGDLYGPLGHEIVEARTRLIAAWRADDGEGSLKALLYSLLDDHERGGLDYTIDLVEQVKGRIDDPANGAIKRLTEASEEYGKHADFFINQRYTPSLGRLREAAQSKLFGGRKTAVKIIDQLADDLRMHLILRIRAIACLEACAMLRETSAFLGDRLGLDEKGQTRWSGLVAEFRSGYDTVSATLDVIRDDVSRLHDARDRPQSGMYFVINDRAGQDIHVPSDNLLEWAKEAFESYKGSKKLFSTLRTPEGKIEVVSQLQGIAQRKLAHFERQIPSVGQALRTLAPNERKALLGKALARAMPWLDANFDRFRAELKGDQFKLYVAVDEATTFRSEFEPDIRDLIPAGFGIQEAGFVESGVPGRLVIYCELSGVPLDVITPLRADWRRSYDRESSKPDSIPLHNHFDWMRFPTPIVPTTEEIERLRTDLNLFIRSVAFGVLKRKASSKPFEPYLLEIRPRDFEQVGSERTIRKKLFDLNQRRSVEEKVLRFEEKLSPLQLIAASALFQYTAERAYPQRREVIGPGQDMRVAGLIHKVVRDLEGDFQGRYIASGNPVPKGLSAGDLKEALYNSIMDWTDAVPDSVKDVDPLEANLDPNDAPEFRAQDKRVIRADRFTDDALRVYAGIQKTPPAPPAGNVIDVPAAVSFYVAVNGESKGPFSGLELSAMATKGELVGTSMVYDAERGDNWVEAASVPALANLFGRRGQPRTPPPPPKSDSGQGKAS
jgi:hypothetical protein